MGDIPALTYTIRQALDRLRMNHDYLQQEIVQTRLLLMGHPEIFTDTCYGLVTTTDPEAHVAGNSDPLVVSANAANQTNVDINPGWLVTKSGMWIEIHDFVRNIVLADPSISVPNVVYIQYMTEDADLEENDYKEPVVPFTMRIGEDPRAVNTEDVLIGVDTVETYLSYPTTVTEDYVPLAVVTTQTVTDPITGATSTQLSIDHTRTNYTWNRPWFTPRDVEHRSMQGSGTYSETNPHAQGISDATVGNFSIIQMLLDHGMVIADDQSAPHVPGYRCTAAITTVLTDDVSGTMTGYAGASYIELPYFPVRVGRVWYASSDETVAAIHVPQTHLVVFPYEVPTPGETINVYYTRAEACEPPLPNATSFATNSPTDNELVAAGGSLYTQLSTTTVAFGDAWQFPRWYELFVDGNGEVIKTPQVVYCYKRLDVLGTSDTPEIDFYGPGKLMMGLVGATPGTALAPLSVKITVYGKDTTGASINHQFVFDNTWVDPGPVPNTAVNYHAVEFSSDVFASINNVVVDERSNDGVASAIMIWNLTSPYSNFTKMKDACHVATVLWDGYRFARVYDKRIVATTVRDFLTDSLTIPHMDLLANITAGGNSTVYVDDFRQPRYSNLREPDDYVGTSIGPLPSYNITKWQPGIHGFYRTIAFPVNPASGTTWRVTLLGRKLMPGDNGFFPDGPELRYFNGAVWPSLGMLPVPGVPDTFEVTLPAFAPRVAVTIYPSQATGMILYG